MPISVVCAGCKTRFEVSEKFAGKQGPCPKCKAIIKIPEAPAEEIKIHVPEEFASAGKDKTGRAISKPIPRRETKVRPRVIAAIIVGSVLALAVALVAGQAGTAARYGVAVVGLLIVGPPLAVGGYFFLRNDEKEIFEGKELWIRAAACSLGYALLWGFYWYLKMQTGMPVDVYQWVFVAPVFIAAGGGLALAAFDLEFSSAALHYCFYLIVTLLLRAAMGLPPLWAVTTGS